MKFKNIFLLLNNVNFDMYLDLLVNQRILALKILKGYLKT